MRESQCTAPNETPNTIRRVKLQEYHAKRLLLAQGLPVPDYDVVDK